MRWLLVIFEFVSLSRGTLKSTYLERGISIPAIGTIQKPLCRFSYPDEDALVLDIAVGNRELVRKRHDGLLFQGLAVRTCMRERVGINLRTKFD